MVATLTKVLSDSMYWRLMMLSLLLVSVVLANAAVASPVASSTQAINANPTASLNKVGAGQMDYLFWSIYKAEYYLDSEINQTTLTVAQKLSHESTRALKIEYLRTIESEALVKATAEQWQLLGYSQNKIDQWVTPLKVIWPNVESGSTLTVKVTPQGASQFYFNNALIGQVQDAQFGQAFLSIWLSEKTSEPELRQQLLGLRK
ncbi:chalcone isomerase family protein [Vibrio sp. ZSDE26]|uniref:Chalcone isomerase family protein n=1 Tax=Vibrio amylolyticus TaxID=2847292 RepID=A0A9X1XM33_9VIBR|nr:chalcone isomerase family protein [Vibrio amylolyticus]MCK6264223.1 chalcone isomerase family protein [Vibrio amylolyticus]